MATEAARLECKAIHRKERESRKRKQKAESRKRKHPYRKEEEKHT
jgi:hypothetical protein